jgi:signal transduction histidine kinase
LPWRRCWPRGRCTSECGAFAGKAQRPCPEHCQSGHGRSAILRRCGRPSRGRALLLFQSVRELLINCAKYAETSEAWVNTNIDTDQLVIKVMDKGRGFESDRPANVSSDVSSNFGLFSIKERMHALGGSFQIVSSPGSGTIAALRLPLSAARASAEASGLSDTCQELSLPLFPL